MDNVMQNEKTAWEIGTGQGSWDKDIKHREGLTDTSAEVGDWQ